MILIHLSRATDHGGGAVCKDLASEWSFVHDRREATFGIEQAHSQLMKALASMRAEAPLALAL